MTSKQQFLFKIAKNMTDKKKFSKIKQKVKQIKTRCRQGGIVDPIRNIFAINSLGAFIIISTIFYIYISSILSLFIKNADFNFMRETMRILECISISIISYFFGGIFNSKTDEEYYDNKQ